MRRPEGLHLARAKRRRDDLRKLAEASGRETFIDSSAPVARYFNATRTLLQQARVYCAEGRTTEAYVLYWRAATFFVERVSKHARYSHSSARPLQVACQKEVNRALQALERLERELLLLFEMEAQSDEAAAVSAAPGATPSMVAAADARLGAAGAVLVQGAPPTGAPASSRPLLPAVQAAMQAFAREADETRRAAGSYPAIVIPQLPARAQGPSVLLGSASGCPPRYAPHSQPAAPPTSLGGSTLLSGFASAPPTPWAPPVSAAPAFTVPPLVPPTAPSLPAEAALRSAAPPLGFAVPAPLPPAGPGLAAADSLPYDAHGQPSRPSHAGCACAPSLSSALAHARGAPAFMPQQGLSARARTVRLPADLSAKFLELARPNTLANVETCGILAGKFIHDELHITHVLVPSQTGSSDQCATTDVGEEEMCLFHVQHDLITLGWIHTHPSQMCFFSSVDLHTQCGYQSMLDEAIGIVLAPRSSPSVGIFRLTTPTGLSEVQQCKESGFHPFHQRDGPGAGNGVYCESEHVVVTAGMSAHLVDMRR